MAVAIFLLILVVGSVVFTFVSPWWFTEIASNWGGIDTTVLITFWVCGVVFVAVGLFMAYATWRYRHREGSRAHYEPENSRLEWGLTIVTTIGVVAMLAPGLIVWDDYVNVPDEAEEFEVLAQQWKWAFRFPGEDGLFGTVDVNHIKSDNPFGMNPEDPRGEDDVLVRGGTVHLPVNQPMKANLRSTDVLHDFFVPEFRAKMDSVPGMITYFWFEPTKPGRYEILCAELCGNGHYTMRGWVEVDTQEDFDAWLASQPTWAQMKAGVTPKAYSAQGRLGREVAESTGCFACHSLDGTQVVGPTWQGLWGKNIPLEDGTTVLADADYIAESIRDPAAKLVEGFAPVMIPYDESTLSEDDLQALIVFLQEETGPSGDETAAIEPAADPAPPPEAPADAAGNGIN